MKDISAKYDLRQSGLVIVLALLCLYLCAYVSYTLSEIILHPPTQPGHGKDGAVLLFMILFLLPLGLFLLSISFASIYLKDNTLIYKTLFGKKSLKLEDVKNITKISSKQFLSYFSIETEYQSYMIFTIALKPSDISDLYANIVKSIRQKPSQPLA